MFAAATTRRVLRLFLVLFGAGAVMWGGYVFPTFWQQSALIRMAGRIVGGEPFMPEAIAGFKPMIDAAQDMEICRPAALHSAAVVYLRHVEQTIANGDRLAMDRDTVTLDAMVRRSLACSPSDSFLWLVLFWLENTRNGFRDDNLKLLSFSYATGPNEGWVALKRNPLALSFYERLPSEIASKVLAEFADLVKAGAYNQAADIFTGAGWPRRALLLAGLGGLAEQHRQIFAMTLRRRGYDVAVPGIQLPPQRPWRP